MYTWQWDVTDGVFKNHAISDKLLEVAAKKMVFVQFTDLNGEFGKRKGETITVFYYEPLATPTNYGLLDERTRIPIDRLTPGSRSFTIKEWGRGVQYTDLNEQLSKVDLKQQIQKLLTRQMGECMDICAAEAFKEAKVLYIPTSSAAGTWDTDGTASTEALANLNFTHLGLIRDYMATDLRVPPRSDGRYRGILTTKALRGIKNDKRFETWSQYLRKGDVIYNSEVGQAEEFRLVETNNGDCLTNGVGSGSVLGEGVFFGDEAVTRIEAEAPHLRANPNFQDDFGRVKAVAWYGTIAYGITWDSADAGKAKVVYVTSS
jgi:N4-gp56 family major capsid protein